MHNLHGYSKGAQFFIFNLKESTYSYFFNPTDTKFHIFGSKNDNNSVHWYTEFTWCFSKVVFLRGLYDLVLDTNGSLSISGDYFHVVNANLKISQYLCFYLKIVCWNFLIKTRFTFWDIRNWDVWKVCLQTFRNNRIC